MGRILIAALGSGLAYAGFLGHRTDYLGYYLAGFGGTLLLLAAWDGQADGKIGIPGPCLTTPPLQG